MKDRIDTNWRPSLKDGPSIWSWRVMLQMARPGFVNGFEYALRVLNAGDTPPGIEDIATVVARVKERHHLVELADDQEPPLYHSDYRDKELYYVICQALKDAGFKKVKR